MSPRSGVIVFAMTLILPALFTAVSFAAPILEASPFLSFPGVTLGDTVSTELVLANRGDALLAVTAIDLPAGVAASPAPPFDLVPGESLRIAVVLAAIDTSNAAGSLTIRSNDPAAPETPVTWRPNVRALKFATRALTTGGRYPLGEAIVVQSTPADSVHIESMTLFYRSGNAFRFQPIEMTGDRTTFIAIIPSLFVLEGGVEYYAMGTNSGFTATDPPLGELRPNQVEVDSPLNYQLSPVVRNAGFIWRAGESIDFLLTLSRGTVFQEGTLFYRRVGESEYQETPILEISFTGIAASIPGFFVGPAGVEYWSEITSLTRTMSDPVEEGRLKPHVLRATSEMLEEPQTHRGGRYRMLSIPLEMPAGTGLPAILTDDDVFGAYDPARWRAFRYLPELRTHVELSPERADAFTLVPGRAFWLISRRAHHVDTAPVPGVSTPAARDFTLVLEPGWNQIGNPFAFPVAWTSVRRTGGVGDPVAYDSELGDYTELVPRDLEPFAGYFIENTSSVPETLSIPAVSTDSVATSPLPAPPAPGEVKVVVALEARCAGGVDRANRAGIASDALTGRDARDRAKPPRAPGASVRLAIAHREWPEHPGLYRHDFRPPDPAGHSWDLEVTSATAGEAIELTIRLEGRLEDGMSLRLFDRDVGSMIDLPAGVTEWRHTVLSLGPEQPCRLTLVMGPRNGDAGAGLRTLPARLELDAMSPNPARGAQRLRFGVPHAMPVRIDVFDVAGRHVARLLEEAEQSAGYHSVIWQPARDAARSASGVHFVRLTAGGETLTVRSVILE